MHAAALSSSMTAVRRKLTQTGALGPIILIHAAALYALQFGMARPTTVHVSAPKEVFASFITPDPVQPMPQPAKPKAVPLTRTPPIAPTRPTAPAPSPTPAPNAIAVPAAAVAPAQPPVAAAPPAPPVAPAPAQPKTISGVEYLQAPQPEYPSLSRRMGEEGKAVLRVLVNEKGRAEHIELQKSSGSPRLDDAARQAIARALFKPYLEDGRAIAVYAIVPITFQLGN